MKSGEKTKETKRVKNEANNKRKQEPQTESPDDTCFQSLLTPSASLDGLNLPQNAYILTNKSPSSQKYKDSILSSLVKQP